MYTSSENMLSWDMKGYETDEYTLYSCAAFPFLCGI